MAVDGDVVDPVRDDARGGSPLDVRLVSRKPQHLRLDVSFGAVHAVTIGIATGAMASSGLFERAFIVGAGAILHALVVLSTHWSVAVDAALTCREISPKEASRAAASGAQAFALVTDQSFDQSFTAAAAATSRRRRRRRRFLRPLAVSVATPPGDALPGEDGVPAADWSRTQLSFEHESVVYRMSDTGNSGNTFAPVEYPDRRAATWYVSRTGHNDVSAEASAHKWGANELRVPRPGFWDILLEQLVAPFFVFQTFCCVLWLADEYWYYSLFTLAMLVVFESTVASQRLRNVDELMSLTPNGASLLVHRGGRWQRRFAKELVPGDVVSVCANGVNDAGEEEVVPADLVLVAGDATVTEAMLTGESTPQRKRAIEVSAGRERLMGDTIDMTIDKTATLFAGTRVLRAEHGSASGGGDGGVRVGRPPDKGCVCVVVRTGFGTAQGELVRTILHTGERVTADSRETYAFIAVLLAFAAVASTRVLLHGLADPARSRYKLFLNCVTILTSVIPPELPMELSIAVNTSLIALSKRRVFCTEPFRVVDAGRCDVCCFDKTGTLTEDELRYEGVATARDVAFTAALAPGDAEGAEGAEGAACDACPVLTTCPGDLSRDVAEAALVLASCHSLALVGGAAAGDPMERAGLAGCDWTLLPQDRSASGASSVARRTARVMTRHAFRSELRRMSAVVAVDGFDGSKRRVVAKGAPETMEATLRKLPAGYRRAHKALARRGYRVIALCAKAIPDDADVSVVKSMTRKECESGLDFLGFAVFACRVKPTSAPAAGVLARSSHASVMITGDAPLTACHVAAEVGITARPTLLLESDGDDDWWWATLEGKKVEHLPLFITTYDTARSYSLASLAREYDLAVCGEGLDAMTRRDRLNDCVKHVRVYARTAPEQKTRIVRAMRDVGLRVMMCGDGTNDVGALRAAHVGVALLHDGARAGRVGGARDGRTSTSGTTSNEKLNGVERLTENSNGDVIAELTRRMEAADDRSAGGRLALAVRPGDASLAAPFTARSGGVAPCVDLVRQGRAALVASQQMFKILGLNCLCTAYVMSVQFLDGVKFGDTQMTIGGLITAGMFLALSRAAPSQRLAPSKPRSTIFTAYFFASVFCQFATHLFSLWYTLEVAKAYVAAAPEESESGAAPYVAFEGAIDADVGGGNVEETPSTHPLESPFAPNLLNTVSFLVNTFTQTATVAVNYVGAPHCLTLRENAPLFYSVLGTYAALGVLTSQIFPELNEAVELYVMPAELASKLCLVMACDLAACWVIERTLDRVFPPTTSRRAAALLEKTDSNT
mmetsp:Transcript_1246/g.5387  ORF Transcript_1246/g.5387 Transcript_1246/m.5387 type:complete len:1295 (+) Transcript_1246:205-4089(+)